MTDQPQKIRLNKFLAERLGVSRREADGLISAGKVFVGDKPAILGARIDKNSKVCYNKKVIPFETDFLYLAFNKPVGYVCSRRAQGNTPTLYELLPKEYQKLKTVGRLDKDSSGLILLTNDGDFAFQMTHPKFHKEKVYEVKPELQEVEGNETYVVGITMGTTEVERGLLVSIRYMFIKMGSLFRQMFITIQGLFTGGIGVNQLSGPVGIYSIVGQQRSAGFENVLYLVALLSVNVGVINLLPLPAFDGGRILFLLIEKIKGSPVSTKFENLIHSIGFILLMILMLYITFNDIFRLF